MVANRKQNICTKKERNKMNIDTLIEDLFKKHKHKHITKEILLEIVNDIEKFEDLDKVED
jgi:Lhr-like helicase